MSIGATHIRIGLGDKEVKNYISPNEYQLVEDGAGEVFGVARGCTVLIELRKASGENFLIIPDDGILETESNDSTV